jgi:hypothetical protein
MVKANVWWILYYDQFGKRHREKVGTRENAISAYQKRKTDIRLGDFDTLNWPLLII